MLKDTHFQMTCMFHVHDAATNATAHTLADAKHLSLQQTQRAHAPYTNSPTT